ncbi:Zinc finger (RING finger) protein [Novymonas esmeraldas]|uniref:RING-type E3 ubiquitin transferase n=1 Tax=Novymonas esmeraldas TaxID=1808958 RepID=A0AAW0F453_9TRYP
MKSARASTADFSCAICLDTASEPVVTRCGHLFCWECLEHWLHSPSGAQECPVCKGRVDEQMGGDIIPLYGKGRQSASGAGARHSASMSPATTGATAAAAAAAAPATTTAQSDAALAAFFSRPTSYSFGPRRDVQQGAQSSSPLQPQPQPQPQPQQQQQDPQHHPRPSAPRAPPRPRRQQQQQRHNDMYLGAGGMQLTMGSGIIFFGGGPGMLFSLLAIAVWALYRYAPWQEWSRASAEWFRSRHGLPGPADEDRRAPQPAAGTAPRAQPTPAADEPAAAAQPEAGGGAAAARNPDSPPADVSHWIVILFFGFILMQLLVYM